MDAQLAYHLRRLALLALFVASLVVVALLAFAWVRSYSPPADPVARHAITFREGRIYFTDANTDLEALEHDREWRQSTLLGFNSRPNVQMCPAWFPFVLACAYPIWWLRHAPRRRTFYLNCTKCGRSLAGHTGPNCPHCGHLTGPRAIQAVPARARWRPLQPPASSPAAPQEPSGDASRKSQIPPRIF
jgi:hypothetical protein